MIDRSVIVNFRDAIPDLPELTYNNVSNGSESVVHAWTAEWRRGIQHYFEGQCIALHGFLVPWIDKHKELLCSRDTEAEALAHAQHALFRNDRHPAQGSKSNGDNQVKKIEHHHTKLIAVSEQLTTCTPEEFLKDLLDRIRIQAHRLLHWVQEDYHAMDQVHSLEEAQKFSDQYDVERHPLSWQAMRNLEHLLQLKTSAHTEMLANGPKKNGMPEQHQPVAMPSPQERKKFRRLRNEHNAANVLFPPSLSANAEGIHLSFAESPEDIYPKSLHFPVIKGEALKHVTSVQELDERTHRAMLAAQKYAEQEVNSVAWFEAMSAGEKLAVYTDQKLQSLHITDTQRCAMIERILKQLETMSRTTPNIALQNSIQKQWLIARLRSYLHPETEQPAYVNITDEMPMNGQLAAELQWKIPLPPDAEAIHIYLSRTKEIRAEFGIQKKFAQRLRQLTTYCNYTKVSQHHEYAVSIKNLRCGQAVWETHFSRKIPKVDTARRGTLCVGSAEMLLKLAHLQTSVSAASRCETAARCAAIEAEKIFYTILTLR